MDNKLLDARDARSRLAERGWIARGSEMFRHLPPPAAEVWLGDEKAIAAGAGRAPAGAGWTLHALEGLPQGRVDARWLDADDAVQRKELFAGLDEAGDDDAAPFAWAHRALCRNGLKLQIGAAPDEANDAKGAAQTVFLELRHRPRAAVEAPLLVLELQAGVHCVLLERHELEEHEGDGGTRAATVVQNLRAHLRLGDGATLAHLRFVAPGAGDRIAHQLRVQLGRGARYDQALIATGSAYHLQRSVIELDQAQAAVHIAGLSLAAGTTLDQQVRVAQSAPDTSSTIEGLVLASGAARTVHNAYTRIAAGADEAITQQRLVGIPIGGQARLVLRPQLEIHHDKVQAAHGATWGALPEDALFYARQRGLDAPSARGLIVQGMATALLERCLGGPELLQTLGLGPRLAQRVAHQLAVPAPAPAPAPTAPTRPEAPHG
ncbi:MAG: SufD family Fe-S cluster assembly protein [Burkholderiales bacterium]|nr:SufD family Fe-S cluster assembly protein [Burkholderiales bacterium]